MTLRDWLEILTQCHPRRMLSLSLFYCVKKDGTVFGVVALISNMMFLVKISCCATELGILVVKFFFRASALT